MTEKELNIIRGKALVGAVEKSEVLALFDYIDSLEALLDGADLEDCFGTEGWRCYLGVD